MPTVSYVRAKQSYFIHNDQVHSVASCPTPIFRSAVLTLAPYWPANEAYSGILAASEIDFAVRWYLLVALAEAGKAMRLYGSREEAEQAVKVAVPGLL